MVSFIMNEAQLYEIVNIQGIVHNIHELEKSAKRGKTLRFRKMSLSNDSDSVTLIVYYTLVHRMVKKSSYEFSDVRVSKYMQQRQLKTNELTTNEIVEEYNFNFRTHDLTDLPTVSMEGTIISADLKTLELELKCPKSDIEEEHKNDTI